MKSIIRTVGSLIISVGVSHLFTLWGKIQAYANIAVRPELMNVDGWTAFFAGHWWDWEWYHDPTMAYILTMIIGVPIMLFIIFVIMKIVDEM